MLIASKCITSPASTFWRSFGIALLRPAVAFAFAFTGIEQVLLRRLVFVILSSPILLRKVHRLPHVLSSYCTLAGFAPSLVQGIVSQMLIAVSQTGLSFRELTQVTRKKLQKPVRAKFNVQRSPDNNLLL